MVAFAPFSKIHLEMKKQPYFLATALAMMLFACAQPEKAPEPTAPEASASASQKAKFPVNCFEQRYPDGSVLSFQYTEYFEDVVGILDYSFAEKDGAHGTFKGTKEGNVITATWNYIVEGSNQTEEEMFKIEVDKALKASGELEEYESGKLKMKDPSKATWEETFTKVDCD